MSTICSRISRRSWFPALLTGAALALAGCGGGQTSPAEEPAGATEDDDDDRTGPRRAMSPDLDEDENDTDPDGAQIEGLRGRLERYDIEQGFNPHANALSACFTRKVGKQRYLGGEVEFKFVVARDGTVKAVHFLRSDLGAWPMEKCMLDIARAMNFAKPKGGGDADFTIPLAFDARQQVVFWNETRGAEEVDDARRMELEGCAEEAGVPDPRNIWITIYIGTRGKVMSAGFASPDGPLADEWAECAAAKIGAWQLSDPRGRAKMWYQYNP